MEEELGGLKHFLLRERKVEDIRGLLEANNVLTHPSSGEYELWVYECQQARTAEVLEAQGLRSYPAYASD